MGNQNNSCDSIYCDNHFYCGGLQPDLYYLQGLPCMCLHTCVSRVRDRYSTCEMLTVMSLVKDRQEFFVQFLWFFPEFEIF